MIFALLSAATAVYGYHLGDQALGPSEAYSALAAAQPTVAKVAHDALQYDPGKTILYHVMLHGFCKLFGLSEAALRCFSLLFGIATLALLFSYGNELFGFEVGFAAAALWAFCPVAVIDARWARMYSLFVALALAHLLTMARLRRKANAARQFLAGVLGTAMLCSHLGAVLLIIGDVIVSVREFRSTGRSVTWPAIVIAIVLFLPFFRLDAAQTDTLLLGHWLDWIGVGQSTLANKLLIVVTATAICLWLTLAGPRADDRSEAFRRCLIYAVLPPLALVVGSILVRPMFNIRYVAPSLAVAILIIAFGFNLLGTRVRNEATFALSVFLLILVPLTYAALAQPWRNIAAIVAAGDQRQTIFFESGFFTHERLISQDQSDGFPNGFFRVPFDYYFKLPNNRGVLPGSDPKQSRLLMTLAVNEVGGAWLLSGKNEVDAKSELPTGSRFQIDLARNFSRVLLFHVRLTAQNRPVSPGSIAVQEGY
jgi:4-amino-4-deoxy-L-arabinose transferase-like glycosyltransferase